MTVLQPGELLVRVGGDESFSRSPVATWKCWGTR